MNVMSDDNADDDEEEQEDDDDDGNDNDDNNNDGNAQDADHEMLKAHVRRVAGRRGVLNQCWPGEVLTGKFQGFKWSQASVRNDQ